MPIEDPYPPLPFQVDVLKEINRLRGRALIALDMGLGKSYCALRTLQKHPEAYPALVVCPAPVKFHWESESRKFINIRPTVCETQTHPSLHEVGFHSETPKITIINQDILSHWMPYLKLKNFKTIIPDECHGYGNTTTLRTKALTELSRSAKFFLPLSGTPLTNHPADLWPIIHMLWPDEFPSFWSFSQTHCAPRFDGFKWVHKGATNLDQLHLKLKRLGMIRRRKEEVLKDLPEKVWRTIPCEINNRSEYQFALDNFSMWLKRNGKIKATKNERMTKVGFLLRLVAKGKIRTPVEWANKFLDQTDEKLIMFAKHQAAIDVLERRINGKKVRIDGGVSKRRRQDAIDQFEHDKKTRVIIGSSALGTGVDGLQRASKEVGIVEFPWCPGELNQWVGRAHRIGQVGTVFVNMFVAVDTIEEDLVKLLHTKQKSISAILDGGPVAADIDVFEDLLRVIEGRLL